MGGVDFGFSWRKVLTESNSVSAKNGTHANQVIDLLKAMNLHVNASQYGGVSITQGIHQKIAFKLYGKLEFLTLNFH